MILIGNDFYVYHQDYMVRKTFQVKLYQIRENYKLNERFRTILQHLRVGFKNQQKTYWHSRTHRCTRKWTTKALSVNS